MQEESTGQWLLRLWKKSRRPGSLFLILLILICSLGSWWSAQQPLYPDIPVLLTMKQLGYADSLTEQVRCRTDYLNRQFYDLRISAEPHAVLELHAAQFPDSVSAAAWMDQQMEKTLSDLSHQDQQCGKGCLNLTGGPHYQNRITELMNELEAKVWHSDEAWAVNALSSTSETENNTLFLRNDSLVLILQLNPVPELTPQVLKILTALPDQDYSFIPKYSE